MVKVISSQCTNSLIDKLLSEGSQISYLYGIKCKSTGKRYVGMRSKSTRLSVDPRLDLGTDYFTSSTDKKFKRSLIENTSNFTFFIYAVSKSVEEISDLEDSILSSFDAKNNRRFYNKSNGGGWSTKGIVVVRHKDTGETATITQDEYARSSDYAGISKGRVTMFDNVTQKHVKVDLEDYYSNKDRYSHFMESMIVVDDSVTGKNNVWVSSDEYKNNKSRYTRRSTGKILVKNKETGKNTLATREEISSNSSLEIFNKGTMTVYDTITNEYKKIQSSEYDTSVHNTMSTGKVFVKGENNSVVAISSEEYKTNREKYEMARSNNIKVFSFDDMEMKVIHADTFKQGSHISVKARFITLFMDGAEVDVFTVSDVYKRYSDYNLIKPINIFDSYKKGKEFTILGRVFTATISKEFDVLLANKYVTYRENKPPVARKLLQVFDSNDEIVVEACASNFSQLSSELKLPRSGMYKSINTNGEFKFYEGVKTNNPIKGWYCKHVVVWE